MTASMISKYRKLPRKRLKQWHSWWHALWVVLAGSGKTPVLCAATYSPVLTSNELFEIDAYLDLFRYAFWLYQLFLLQMNFFRFYFLLWLYNPNLTNFKTNLWYISLFFFFFSIVCLIRHNSQSVGFNS